MRLMVVEMKDESCWPSNTSPAYPKEAELASIIWQVSIVLAMEESKPSTKKDKLLAGISYLISQNMALALLLDA